jgi:hypothetical protein
MSDGLLNIVLGIAASAISAGLGWLAQTLRRRRRLNRVREFFGLGAGNECLLVVPRNTSHPDPKRSGVSLRDAYALMELSGLVKECGAQPDVISHDRVQQGVGTHAEFCLGGPGANVRMASHLSWRFPGVTMGPYEGPAGPLTLTVGGHSWDRVHQVAEYAMLARIPGAEGRRPVFLICGQTAMSNQAAVRYLIAQQRSLRRTYGMNRPFCLVIKAINTPVYGPDVVELVGDFTQEAMTAREPAPTTAPAPGGEPDTGAEGSGQAAQGAAPAPASPSA